MEFKKNNKIKTNKAIVISELQTNEKKAQQQEETSMKRKLWAKLVNSVCVCNVYATGSHKRMLIEYKSNKCP